MAPPPPPSAPPSPERDDAADRASSRRFRGVHALRIAPSAAAPLTAWHSRGAGRRAGQLQRFVGDLQRTMDDALEPGGRCELLVFGAEDWRRLYRYPYGLPFTRTRGGRGHGRPAETVDVVAAADYPGRLVRRFDATRARAARAGVATPGDVREFLDLLIGHEWGHAAANTAGVRTRVRWLDEWMATYLFLLALHQGGHDALLERFVAWGRLGRAGAGEGRSDLGSFERRRRLSLEDTLWFQGVFTERAHALLHHGWSLPLALREVLPAGRGAVARELVAFDPSFRSWFATFAPDEARGSGGAPAIADPER